MKIALDCRSELLRKSLETFLGEYLAPESEAEILVADYEARTSLPLFRIGSDEGADLRKPFSRSQLMIRLEEALRRRRQSQEVQNFVVEEEEETLEEKIERATRRFVEEIVTIVRSHDETRP